MNETGARQRLDKWLWFARILKSRTLAQKFIATGAVRVDKARVTSPDCRVGPGTVLTFALNQRIRVLRVLDPGVRRGPASEARALYEDLSPEPPPKPETLGEPVPGTRPRGSREVARRRL
ncbi:MAG: RNA-binding S4 domain-containing protein [Alphaproteobacteria bacterium]|nr:RNA-binding S4 domain-containing protein [Alphaproteobacteria bacterium]